MYQVLRNSFSAVKSVHGWERGGRRYNIGYVRGGGKDGVFCDEGG